MAVYNIELKSNENLKITYTMLEADSVTPVDISGTVVTMQIRVLPTDTDSVFETSSATGSLITIDEPTSTITIDIPWSTVADWTFTTAYYDVIIAWSSLDHDNISDGKIKLSKGVTR